MIEAKLQAWRLTLMQKLLKPWFVITASGLLLSGCCTSHHVTRWEYKTEPNIGDVRLNKEAEAGWTVVNFTETISSEGKVDRSYLLKRPKP
jgi:hypothetical protein